MQRTEAKFRRWDYLKFGEVRHGSRFGAICAASWRGLAGFVAAIFMTVAATAFVPVLGIEIGLGLELASIAIAAASGWARYGIWSGCCPHCQRNINIHSGTDRPHPFDCPICKRRVLLEEEIFAAL